MKKHLSIVSAGDRAASGRRTTLRALAVASASSIASSIAIPALGQPAWAPSRPVRIIVPYGAGGGADLITRRVAERAAAALGQPVIVENRPGAGTAIGAAAVAQAPADGLTLLLATSTTLCVNPVLRNDLPYRPDDFEPVAALQLLPFMVSATKQIPVRTMAEFVAYARKHPGKLNYGTLGIGSSNHVLGGLLSKVAGLDLEPVHYQSGPPALLALIRGDVHLYFDGISTSIPRIRNGGYTPLAVTGAERVDAAPEVPTIAEAGYPQAALSVWYGLVARRGTPPDASARLNAVFNRVLADADLRTSMVNEGTRPLPLTVAAFDARIREDTAGWRHAIEALGMKAG